MSDENATPDLIAYECKHATYVRAQDGSNDDILAIKEVAHHPDGTREPGLRLVENMKRPFYITYEGQRTYKQKKDWESLERLQRFDCTQAELNQSICYALQTGQFNRPLRELGRSPYLYGADITTTTIAKHRYQTRFPDTFSDNSVAVLDIETDVVEGHKSIVYISITFKDRAFLATTEAFVKDLPDFEAQVQREFADKLGEYQQARHITLEIMRCKSPGEACAQAIQRAHAWKPDFLSIWNMDFDIPRIIKALEEANYDIGDVFSDPLVPKKYRYAQYRPGQHFKRTASGKHQPLDGSMRWHVMTAPASFYVIDSMCLYRQLRLAQQKEPSYALDSLLEKHLGVRKLKYNDRISDSVMGIEWHRHMQCHERVAYAIYNLFDCISVELFDEKLRDLSQSISIQSGFSDYGVFNSQPKRLVDKLHMFYLERGKVIATRSDQIYDEALDSKVLGREGWIVTLKSHLMCEPGLPVIKDHPHLPTMLYSHVSDLD